MKGSGKKAEKLTADNDQLAKNKSRANKAPKGFKPLVNRRVDRDGEFALSLERPDATSVEEVRTFLDELPDCRCTFDRCFGFALWSTKDEAVWKIENAFRQRYLGNWTPYLTIAKDPATLKVLNALDALEATSQKMSMLNDEAKPLVIKLAQKYFANPSRFPAAAVKHPRWMISKLLPAAACLPEVLCGRLVAPLFNREVRRPSAGEQELTKLIFELFVLDFEYGGLGLELDEAESTYLNSHPEDFAD